MDKTVVETAELDQVVETGRTTPGPVVDVMSIDVPSLRAAWKSTSLVSMFEGPAQGWWNGAPFAANVHGSPLPLRYDNDTGVTSQAPGGLGRQARPLFELARSFLVM
jgi:hypothetical protein